ncbi:MAG: glaB 1 [Paenibacillus sp.]|nr:glaB 1 [Paenibacillus sp.]
MSNCVYLNDFSGSSDWERLATAAEYLRGNPGSRLIIPAGVYDVTTPLAKQTMEDVIDGKYGRYPEKKMFRPDFPYSKGFDLSGIQGASIEADGALFLVDGFMEPVSITNSQDIRISGLIIDHKRKPYSKGVIQDVVITDAEKQEGYIVVAYGPEYPLGDNYPMPRFVIFDEFASRFVGYGEYGIRGRERVDENTWKYYGHHFKTDYRGKEFYIWHTFHSRPAIRIENAKNVTLFNVTIHSQPGMGIVAHRSENLEFNGLRVVPSAGEHMSTNTDATHITSCKGYLRYISCEFEGQGDDSLNVHTYYHTILSPVGSRCTLRVDAPTGTHSQTLDYPDEGDILELTAKGTLAVTELYRVVKSTPDFTNMTCDVELDRPLPENCERVMFANGTRCPELFFKNCFLHNHIARGVLIKTKKATIEHNTFIDLVGTAIVVAAEEWWYEGLCSTENIVIRGNRILNCARTGAMRANGSGGICVMVSCDDPSVQTHKNVVIEDNIIDCHHSEYGIYVSNTEHLTIARNSVVSAESQPVHIK